MEKLKQGDTDAASELFQVLFRCMDYTVISSIIIGFFTSTLPLLALSKGFPVGI